VSIEEMVCGRNSLIEIEFSEVARFTAGQISCYIILALLYKYIT